MSPSSLVSTQQQLLRRFQQAGGLNQPLVTNPEIIHVQREGKQWLNEAHNLITHILSTPDSQSPRDHSASSIKDYALSSLPSLLHSYDLVYRLVNGQPCHDYIRSVRLQTLQLWLKGNHTISRTEVALMILHEADRDNRTLDNRYSLFALGILQEWVDELTLYGRFRGIPAPEAHRRLNYILSAHLHAYLGPDEPRLKARWAQTLRNAQ